MYVYDVDGDDDEQALWQIMFHNLDELKEYVDSQGQVDFQDLFVDMDVEDRLFDDDDMDYDDGDDTAEDVTWYVQRMKQVFAAAVVAAVAVVGGAAVVGVVGAVGGAGVGDDDNL